MQPVPILGSVKLEGAQNRWGAKLGFATGVALGATSAPVLLLSAAGGVVILFASAHIGTALGKAIINKVYEWTGQPA